MIKRTRVAWIREICDPESNVVQIIEFESSNNWGYDSFEIINVNEWKVVDINFDGFKDIICLESIGGAKGSR